MIKQAFNSLFRVSCKDFKCNLQFKIITLLNLIKKGAISILGFTPNLTMYKFNECVLSVKFNKLTFYFLCPKDRTFHIYMNPYFHEYDISTFIYDTLGEGDTFMDIGAMGGLYSIISAIRVGKKGKVISVEPNPDNLHFLQRNIELNNLHNITLVKTAVGEKNSKITLYYDPESTESTSLYKGERKKSFEVEMVTLDAISEKEVNVKILKIDTEGCDEKVLRGGRKTLQKTDYCIVETNNESIRKLLNHQGFNYQTMHPSGYLLAKRNVRTDLCINLKT